MPLDSQECRIVNAHPANHCPRETGYVEHARGLIYGDVLHHHVEGSGFVGTVCAFLIQEINLEHRVRELTNAYVDRFAAAGRCDLIGDLAGDEAVHPVPTDYEGWAEVQAEIQRVGHYGQPQFENPLVAQVVESLGLIGRQEARKPVADMVLHGGQIAAKGSAPH